MEIYQKKINLFFIFLLVSIQIIYSNFWYNTFHFDDFHTITDNLYIRSLGNFKAFFTDVKTFSTLPSHASWRPIVTLSLAIDYWLGDGLDPRFFHLSMMFFFLLQLLVMFYIFKAIFEHHLTKQKTTFLSMLAVTWYSFHPVCAETLNYIIARSDLLSTFFLLLSFILYIKFPAVKKYYLYLIPLTIGVMAKPTALMFLPIILLYEVIFLEKKNIFNPLSYFSVNIAKTALPLIAHFGLMYWLIKQMETGTFEAGGTSLFHYIITQPYVYAHYVEQFFLPLQLSADTDWQTFENIYQTKALLGFGFLAFLLFVIYKTQKNHKTKPIAFGLSFFLVALIPTTFIALAEVNNDHRMFFPFVGLVLAVVCGIDCAYESFLKKLNLNFILSAVVAFTLLGYAYGTHQRNEVWTNEETLWKDVSEKSPQNGRGLMNYGLSLMGKGNYIEAEKCFIKALAFTPYYASLNANLGIVSQQLNKPEKAKQYFEQAVAFGGSDQPNILYFYARYQNEIGETEKAIKNLYACLDLSAGLLTARELLMTLLYETDKFDDLEKMAKQTLARFPENQISENYLHKIKLGNNRLTVLEAETKIQKTPANYINLSLYYYQSNQFQKCIEAAEQAIKIDPNNAIAYNNICTAYNALKQFDKAQVACKKALSINPDFLLAKNNLQVANKK